MHSPFIATWPPPSSPTTSFLDDLARQLPDLLRSKRLRPALEALQPVEVDELPGLEVNRAYLIYTFLANAYVHSIGEERAGRLPPGVAAPLCKLAGRLEKPLEVAPCLSYETYVLYNWRRKQQEGLIALENLETLVTFCGLPDESWFILVHTEIEAEAAPALRSILPAQQAVLDGDADTLDRCLGTIRLRRTGEMVGTLRRMEEGNSPNCFYRDFRPYLMFFTGVVYDGVEELGGKPQSPIGETGAQSSIMPSLDATLGVRHRPTGMTDYIAEMRRYMPLGHRAFIETIERGPSIRDLVRSAGRRRTTRLYNACLDQAAAFRGQHLEWADRYINQKVADPRGTGGTPFMVWLARLRDEALEARLANRSRLRMDIPHSPAEWSEEHDAPHVS